MTKQLFSVPSVEFWDYAICICCHC